MNTCRAWLVLAMCLASTGCSLYKLGARNLFCAPVKCIQEHIEDKREDSHAWAAWHHVAAEAPPGTYSIHYRRGFIRGYADYLEYGGKGEPPTAPPQWYWNVHKQTPAGHQAAEEWFAGFRHGSAVAQASGQRQWVTVPLSATLPPDRYSVGYGSGAGPASMPAPEMLPTPVEQLPPPRLMPEQP